jgi:hypothetical protein
VKYGDDNNRVAAIAKEDAVWESPRHGAANVARDQRENQRRVCHPVDRSLNCMKKFVTQASPLLLVPGSSL